MLVHLKGGTPMVHDTLVQFAKCLDILELRYDLEEESDRIYTCFRGDHASYSVTVRAFDLSETVQIVRFRAYVSLREHQLPILAITPTRLDEAQRFINYLNARWMDAGHLFFDPVDGDLSLDWTVPVVTELTPEFVDRLLHFLGQVQHFFPEVQAILGRGISTVDAIAAHRARDEAAANPADSEASDGNAPAGDNPDAESDETFPFPF
jgi:hypothetical protein